MLVEDFLKTNPTREEIANRLCRTANLLVLPINTLWCWERLCRMFELSIDDFYNDTSELTDYEIYVIGLYNWKFNDDKKE